MLGLVYEISVPIYPPEGAQKRLSEGRLWPKENGTAFASRDLDEFTHTKPLGRTLDSGVKHKRRRPKK
jgi:hypothetical protein